MDQCMSTFALKTYQALIFPRKVNKQINTIDNKSSIINMACEDSKVQRKL